MSYVRRLVLDVMKPHDPSVIDISESLARLEKVHGVNIVVVEIDREVENVKITIEGEGLDYVEIKKNLSDFGVAIHSIDLVASGKKLIEESQTPQDL